MYRIRWQIDRVGKKTRSRLCSGAKRLEQPARVYGLFHRCSTGCFMRAAKLIPGKLLNQVTAAQKLLARDQAAIQKQCP